MRREGQAGLSGNAARQLHGTGRGTGLPLLGAGNLSPPGISRDVFHRTQLLRRLHELVDSECRLRGGDVEERGIRDPGSSGTGSLSLPPGMPELELVRFGPGPYQAVV